MVVARIVMEMVIWAMREEARLNVREIFSCR